RPRGTARPASRAAQQHHGRGAGFGGSPPRAALSRARVVPAVDLPAAASAWFRIRRRCRDRRVPGLPRRDPRLPLPDPAAPARVGARYDVVDHSRLSAGLGGEAAFRDMVAAFRRHGLGVVADIVPNHMAIGVPESLNRQFWSVLRDGPGSAYAHWFDIDWPAGDGRLLLPLLAGPLGECLADLTVDHGGPDGPVLRYYGHALPLRPGTEDLPLADLAAAQHYRLASWRAAATELNWRRFFDVTSLIAIRVEDED